MNISTKIFIKPQYHQKKKKKEKESFFALAYFSFFPSMAQIDQP
jgi:hypothetical protein